MLYFSAPLNSEMHSWRRFDKLFVIRCVEWAFHLLWLLIQLQPLLAVALVVTTTEGFVPTIKEVRWIINPVVTWCILTSTVMKSILCLVGIGLRKNPIWRSWGPKNLILKIVLLNSLNCNVRLQLENVWQFIQIRHFYELEPLVYKLDRK